MGVHNWEMVKHKHIQQNNGIQDCYPAPPTTTITRQRPMKGMPTVNSGVSCVSATLTMITPIAVHLRGGKKKGGGELY